MHLPALLKYKIKVFEHHRKSGDARGGEKSAARAEPTTGGRFRAARQIGRKGRTYDNMINGESL
ncbi:hypothetical protein KSZ_26830 [Dictyobacter formicarum]|uniref:Uncharacterized protein n=1 Tax=Dictyobacter formicarum TaxID=2778368 RepID=A0ABQ3VEU2_9CHLR|nr:hypothetical protein KSZ_26830 [Dictyobacter formicarum]